MLIYLLIFVFAYTRLINLMGFPPFLDETIYIRWLETIKNTNYWLLSLKEFGWAPLTTWISALINIFVKENLLSLRLSAGFFGFLSLIIAYKLARLFFKQSLIVYFISILIILSPIVLIHDRLGLRGDSAVTFSALLLLYGLFQRLIKKKKNTAFLIGLAIALGLLIKSTAWIFPLIVILAYLFFKPKLTKSDFLAGLLPTSAILFYFFTNSLSAFLNKTNVFLVPPDQSASLFKNNLIQLFQWSYQYLSWPVLLMIIFGAIITFKKHYKIWLLLTISIVPVIIFDLFFAKIFFPRYLLFITVYSFFFAGFGISFIWKKLPAYLKPLLLLIVFLPNLLTDVAIIKDIKTAKLPEIERWQYVTGWPSGYNLKELTDYLKSNPPDILITETDDLIKSGIPYLWPEHSMEIIFMNDNLQLTATLPVDKLIFLALNTSEQLPSQFKGELIKKFPRPENKTSIKLYKIQTIE